MQPNEYVPNAIRTEAHVENIGCNELFLTSVVSVLIHMGNMLDQIKKHAFYGKPYDMDELAQRMAMVRDTFITMQTLTPEEIEGNEHIMKTNPRLFHSIVGIATESTELLEALDLYGVKPDNVNILEEFGDIAWYTAIGIDELGGDWENILAKNIEKLQARYPEKFTSEAAINRDLDNERTILEEQTSK